MKKLIAQDCPLCKGNATGNSIMGGYDETTKRVWYVECKGCSARGPVVSTRQEAIEQWNRLKTVSKYAE